MTHRRVKTFIRICMLSTSIIAGCSTDQASVPDSNTVKPSQFTVKSPQLLRAIDSSELTVVVRVNGDGEENGTDYLGEQRPDRSWFVLLQDLTLEQEYTFVASWYGNTSEQKVLLVEQRGEFYTDPTNLNLQATTDDVSEGEQFDADCDGIWNLDEMGAEPPSDPLSSPGCDGPPEPMCRGNGTDTNSSNYVWNDNCELKLDNPFYNSTYVVGIQRILYCRGHAVGTGDFDKFSDGLFGPNTDLAVRNFQEAEGLVKDGIVGKETWGRMQELVETSETLVPEDSDTNYNAYGVTPSVGVLSINCSQQTNFFGRLSTDPDAVDLFEGWELAKTAGVNEKGSFSIEEPSP